MSDKLSLIETTLIDKKVQIILRQTDYTEDQSIEKLKEHDFNEIAVIRSYLGIAEKKVLPVTSLNQEIYKQLRHRLDKNMRNYQDRVNKGEAKQL
jgi:hypothetical protein